MTTTLYYYDYQYFNDPSYDYGYEYGYDLLRLWL